MNLDLEVLRKQILLLSGEEQEKAAVLLVQLEEALNDNPLYRLPSTFPYPQQEKFLSWRGPVPGIAKKLFAGGNQAGKTTVGVVDDIIQAIDRDMVPPALQKYKHWEPPFLCRIICPSFDNMKMVMFEKVREYLPKSQLKGGEWSKAYDKQSHILHFKNGSYFQFMSSDQDVEKFQGWTGDRIHFDEEPPGDSGKRIYDESLVRVLQRNGQIMFTMTPLLGLSWSYDEFIVPEGDERILQIRADMDDNPSLSNEAKEDLLKNYTKEQRKARKEGHYVHFQGMIYGEFDEDKHVVTHRTRNDLKNHIIIVSIDPGLNTTGIVWTAFNKDTNNCLVFDEIYAHEAVPEQIAKMIHQKNKKWDIRPEYYLIDPSARNRATINAETVISAFSREEIYCVPAQNDVEAGVMLVKGRFQSNTIKIAENCEKLLWERARYRYKSTDENPQKFGVVKRDDHLLDALRYACMAMAWENVEPPKPLNLIEEYRFQLGLKNCPTGLYT